MTADSIELLFTSVQDADPLGRSSIRLFVAQILRFRASCAYLRNVPGAEET
jgi:hypothetical protein